MPDQAAPTTVADALIEELARVRDHVMPSYIEIGEPGRFALTLMRQAMDAATRALAEQDALACLRSLDELRGFHKPWQSPLPRRCSFAQAPILRRELQ